MQCKLSHLGVIVILMGSQGCFGNDIIRIDYLGKPVHIGIPAEEFRETVIKVTANAFFTVIPIREGATWGPVELRIRDSLGGLQSRYRIERKERVGSLDMPGCIDYARQEGLLYYFDKGTNALRVYDVNTRESRILLDTGQKGDGEHSVIEQVGVLPQKVRVLSNGDLLVIYERCIDKIGQKRQILGYVTVLRKSGSEVLDESVNVDDYVVDAESGQVLVVTWTDVGRTVYLLDSVGVHTAKREIAQFPRMTSIAAAFSDDGTKVLMLCREIDKNMLKLKIFGIGDNKIESKDLDGVIKSERAEVNGFLSEGKGRVGFLVSNPGLIWRHVWYNVDVATGAYAPGIRGHIAPFGVMKDSDALVSECYR